MKQSNNNGQKVPLYKRILKWALIAFGIFLILLIPFLIHVFSGLPSLEELENPRSNLATIVYDVNEERIGTFFIENRVEVSSRVLPQHLKDALLATEDRQFYDHWGVDLERFGKAIIKNIFTFSREGASTLTQQLAKNLFQLKEKNETSFETIVRKVREWITSVQIERTYTKEEILEMYLNISYFGKSAYGIESAAQIFFAKPPSELTLLESAMLIGILKSSVVYDPIRNYDNALRRRNQVLLNMVDAGYLTDEEFDNLKQTPIVTSVGIDRRIKSEAPYFLEHIRQTIGADMEKMGYDIYRDGLRIYTTLDLGMQRIANTVVSEHLQEVQKAFNGFFSWNGKQDIQRDVIEKAIKQDLEYKTAVTKSEKEAVRNRLLRSKTFIDSVKNATTYVQGAFVAVDPRNGQIRVMVGGRDQSVMYGLNHVTQVRRQPGSSFKPLVYAAAMEAGLYPAFSVLNEKFNKNGWSPDNSGGGTGGYMSLRKGLTNSVNIVAGRLVVDDHVSLDKVVSLAKDMGINSPLQKYYSIALGVFEVTPLEMATAYGTLANKGVYNSPIAVLRVEDKNGIVIKEYVNERRAALSESSAFMVADMMRDVIKYGTGAGIGRWFNWDAAGKTGTTQNYADAWFCGFIPQLAAATWVGFDDHRIKFGAAYGQGARAALPIWGRFFGEVSKQARKFKLSPLVYDAPESVEKAEFCSESISRGEAGLAVGGCSSVVTDYISKDKKPSPCPIHTGGLRNNNADESDIEW